MPELNIGDLDYGFSFNGFNEYKEQIKHIVLQEVPDVIKEQQENVKTALNKGWAGQSRQNFDKLFDQACTNLVDALLDEYTDLDSRLNEIINDYVNQDLNMIIE